MNLEQLVERAHAMALEKGWWEGGVENRPVVEVTNNLHAEISEAWEEWRAGRMELWWSHREQSGMSQTDIGSAFYMSSHKRVECGWKPEGFWIEIADLMIRTADAMGAWGDGLPTICGWYDEDDFPEAISQLHELAHDSNHGVVLVYCIEFARHHGIDILALCELKMAYNATRSHRHGGKRA